VRILIKYPSRSRPERFFQGLESIVNNVADTDNYAVSVTLDLDDETMNNKSVVDRINEYQNVSIQWGLSDSKIHAVNRDLPEWGEIIMVMSDDMRINFWGFDQIIRNEFKDGNLDRLIHIPDQDAKKALATVYIAGREYYNRFAYIYHPSYKSVWCDNEVQDVAKQLDKYVYVDCPGVIEHLNPAYGHYQRDEMFNEQQGHWNYDEANYYKRRLLNFPI
jgi:hypothetical protein